MKKHEKNRAGGANMMKRKYKILIVILILLAAAGFNGSLYSSNQKEKNRGHREKKGKTDNLEFIVESSKIQYTRIKLKFNQPVNPASITSNSLYLLGENNIKLEHEVKLKARQKMVAIKLKNPVNLLKPLILVLSPEISSQNGSKLEKGFIKLFNINLPPGPHQKKKDFFHQTIVICADPYVEVDPGLFFLAPYKKGRIWGMNKDKPDKDEIEEWKILEKHLDKLHRQKLEELENKGKSKGPKKGGLLTLEKILDWFHRWCHWPEIVLSGISDGDLVNHDVTCHISIDDIDGDAWFYNAVLDFSPYQSGTAITTEGSHWLLAVGVDRW
jgi:hypothetical protein